MIRWHYVLFTQYSVHSHGVICLYRLVWLYDAHKVSEYPVDENSLLSPNKQTKILIALYYQIPQWRPDLYVWKNAYKVKWDLLHCFAFTWIVVTDFNDLGTFVVFQLMGSYTYGILYLLWTSCSSHINMEANNYTNKLLIA